MQSSCEIPTVKLARGRRLSEGIRNHRLWVCPSEESSPDCHAGRQVLQVSWIEELGHVQAQFVAGFQKHVHIVLQIQMTQADEAAMGGRLCCLGSEDYCYRVSECDW